MTDLIPKASIQRSLANLDQSTANGRLLADALVTAVQVGGDNKNVYDHVLEFFTTQIPNENTRTAYCRAVRDFFVWIRTAEPAELADVEPVHITSYLEQIGKTKSAPTVNQNLAAIRSLFDWLVTGQVLATNPATAVRGPKYSQLKGKTPVLSPEDARKLIYSIPTDTIAGLRDRALISMMIYCFSRVSAALQMTGKDVFTQKQRLWVRLAVKGGKYHELPCHRNLEQILSDYRKAAGFDENYSGPLFPTVDRHTRTLSDRPLDRTSSLMMVKRRAKQAGLEKQGICNHTFRGTGIAAYLANPDARLERAQHMAAHSDPRATSRYGRWNEDESLEDVEKIQI